ncbi:TetR/AcrR family transcriptional regulator [Brachybacterium paraconglomeratum]|uniref:TetR/AcrR family transcriptional regulator n=1 Tax=Brachybacterium paraconglomeratum TaxID=173362 RepID=UPI0022DF8514|nr:TetR family transcriptional regulator [Brachybacterium paraconglomeratum]
MRLFDERGFEDTTVDDIVAAAEISPRTFFRYFGKKDEVVFADLLPAGGKLVDTLVAELAEHSPWEALRRTLAASASRIQQDSEHWLRVMRVINASPALRVRNLDKHLAWADLFVPHIAAHPDVVGPLSELRAQALVEAALSCLDAALTFWTQSDGSPAFSDVLEGAFDWPGRTS